MRLLRVSMHLLVLSAFRPGTTIEACIAEGMVSMHLLVLSAFRLERQHHERL